MFKNSIFITSAKVSANIVVKVKMIAIIKPIQELLTLVEFFEGPESPFVRKTFISHISEFQFFRLHWETCLSMFTWIWLASAFWKVKLRKSNFKNYTWTLSIHMLKKEKTGKSHCIGKMFLHHLAYTHSTTALRIHLEEDSRPKSTHHLHTPNMKWMHMPC